MAVKMDADRMMQIVLAVEDLDRESAGVAHALEAQVTASPTGCFLPPNSSPPSSGGGDSQR